MQKQVLCIDDDESILLVRRLLLETFGFTIHTAATPREGLEIFNSNPIDAVVLDYMMPEMDGGDVCVAIKKINPKMPVIMISGYPWVEEAVMHLADAFISKGDHPEVLLGTLKTLLQLA